MYFMAIHGEKSQELSSDTEKDLSSAEKLRLHQGLQEMHSWMLAITATLVSLTSNPAGGNDLGSHSVGPEWCHFIPYLSKTL